MTDQAEKHTPGVSRRSKKDPGFGLLVLLLDLVLSSYCRTNIRGVVFRLMYLKQRSFCNLLCTCVSFSFLSS